ncbi:hypothetical protein KPH14_010271 [Odynerus spinipes]|uniref:Uncharacterized protein n=1 Tax=Odynerus spinipes TaxID=1348599 RepID=A0AAD9RUV6_9HYME|nr:hypothetical protein KPH14_010271 [Odynerus spinipes]
MGRSGRRKRVGRKGRKGRRRYGGGGLKVYGAEKSATSGITFGDGPMFVDWKFSGWRLFWLGAIISYVRFVLPGDDEGQKDKEG